MGLTKQQKANKKAGEASKIVRNKRIAEEEEKARVKRRKCDPTEPRNVTPNSTTTTPTNNNLTASQIFFSEKKQSTAVLFESPVTSTQSDLPPCPHLFNHSNKEDTAIQLPATQVQPLQNSTVAVVHPLPTGRRLLSCTSLHENIMKISQHAKICDRFDLSFVKETTSGMESSLYYKCKCGYFFAFKSSTPKESLKLNAAVAIGTLSSATGYDDMKRFLTPLDVKTCSVDTLRRYQMKYLPQIQIALRNSMKQAAVEEMKLAYEAGDLVEVDGRELPWICVIVVGSWAKRSYGHSYNSNYGMAAIIGYRTKKVLFVGHRQKTCSICQKRKALVGKKKHDCHKNHDGPSTAMEPDIILEGFQQSIEKQGLVYRQFIGDGDSSVHKKVELVYPGVRVEKLECSNHVIRNMNTKLRDIAQDSYKRRKIGLEERKMVGNGVRFQRVGRAVMGSMNFYNKKLLESGNNKWADLAADIRNIPYHIFGRHLHCKGYFCETRRVIDLGIPFVCEEDVVDQIRDTQLFQAVMEVLERPAQLARSLIRKVTSNLVECFMSVVAKYLNGKRCNLGGGRLYEVKISSAALCFNQSPFWAYDVYKLHYLKSPHVSWKQLSEKQTATRVNARKTKKIRGKKLDFPFPKEKKGDTFYGSNPMHPDLPEDELLLSIAQKRAELQVDLNRQQGISERTKTQASNPEWFSQRQQRITASIAKRVYTLGPRIDNNGLLSTIFRQSSLTTDAIKWGKEMEKTAIAQYERKRSLLAGTVKPSGLIVSLENGIFAASPDGLVGDEGLLEVKCPFKLKEVDRDRWTDLKTTCIEKVNGGERLKLNHEYYFQVVMQLYVTERKWVDFFMWSPTGFFLQRIEKDGETLALWRKMTPKLESFWQNDLAPELVNSRINRGYTEFRCPAERMLDRQKKLEKKVARLNQKNSNGSNALEDTIPSPESQVAQFPQDVAAAYDS